MATAGGFVAGGSAGVGSLMWGVLKDRGNVVGARLVTMEENPRVLELAGDDVIPAIHAYGTNGVITEVSLPSAPAWSVASRPSPRHLHLDRTPETKIPHDRNWHEAIVVFEEHQRSPDRRTDRLARHSPVRKAPRVTPARAVEAT